MTMREGLIRTLQRKMDSNRFINAPTENDQKVLIEADAPLKDESPKIKNLFFDDKNARHLNPSFGEPFILITIQEIRQQYIGIHLNQMSAIYKSSLLRKKIKLAVWDNVGRRCFGADAS